MCPDVCGGQAPIWGCKGMASSLADSSARAQPGCWPGARVAARQHKNGTASGKTCKRGPWWQAQHRGTSSLECAPHPNWRGRPAACRRAPAVPAGAGTPTPPPPPPPCRRARGPGAWSPTRWQPPAPRVGRSGHPSRRLLAPSEALAATHGTPCRRKNSPRWAGAAGAAHCSPGHLDRPGLAAACLCPVALQPLSRLLQHQRVEGGNILVHCTQAGRPGGKQQDGHTGS